MRSENKMMDLQIHEVPLEPEEVRHARGIILVRSRCFNVIHG